MMHEYFLFLTVFSTEITEIMGEMYGNKQELTPAAVATKPLTNVALPMILLNSSLPRPMVALLLTAQLSKAEKRMEVEIPPSTRPKRRMGKEGMSRRVHVAAYVMQKRRQRRRRPLDEWRSRLRVSLCYLLRI